MPIDPRIPKRIIDQIRQLLIGSRSFDPARVAFINPADITKPLPDFPKICVSTFSEAIIEKYAAREGVTKIAELYTANGALPVYRTVYGGTPIAFFLSRVGAPACAAGLEEIIAIGAGKIVLFGSCGILDESRMEGRFLIPTAAVREEGTSFHYAPESKEIPMEPSSVQAMTKCLDTCGYPYVTGKVWTMDAIYRETADKIEKRRNQGCLAVEMECAAAIAVARFRGVKFAQFLYGADNLDSDIWEPRDLTDYGMTNGEKYLSLAFECGLAL
ncbi:MAG: nucleoside phosphorylase [Lachnospiraceae bacterium]|nr:nucleoside phosphorylase [Lachnospiraceae bacterium]